MDVELLPEAHRLSPSYHWNERARSRSSFLPVLSALLLAACSGPSGGSFVDPPTVDPNDAGQVVTTDAADAGQVATPDAEPDLPAKRTFTVSTGGITLAPGEERVVCVDRRIGNDRAVDVARFSSELTEGGHHLVFYKSDATEESSAPFACETFRGITSGLVPLYIAQKAHTELVFPAGVAYAMPAAQMVRIELHFLNTTSQPLDVIGTVHLETTSGTVKDHANLLFYGNLAIRVPPLSMATVGPTFRRLSAPPPRIFGLTGHQHKRGTGVTIELASGVTGPSTLLYENHDWADPPLTVFDPPIETTPGQGLRYTCTYHNPTNQTIGFGESVNQEMCFLWAYYYPDMGFQIGFN